MTFTLRTILQALTESLGAGLVPPNVYRKACVEAKKTPAKTFTTEDFLKLTKGIS